MNNHYVPRFIQKKFSDRLSIFNVRTGTFNENVKPENAFSEDNLYEDEIEKKINEKIEVQFSDLLTKTILTASEKLSLSRKELFLIKKYLLISVLRGTRTEGFLKFEQGYYDRADELLRKTFSKENIEKTREFDKFNRPPFVEKKIDNETDFDYWMRTLSVILDSDGTAADISRNPLATYPAFRWANVINTGFLGIWDSEFQRDEFIITDIGMTSENEVGWNGITNHNTKKTLFITSLLSDKKLNEQAELTQPLFQQLNFLCNFTENFMMFPISAKRMLVLINPFYKFRKNNKLDKVLPLNMLTGVPNEALFEPNEVKYFLPQSGYSIKFHDNDEYFYEIKQLSRGETRYVNCLFLDRIDTFVGFSELNKVVGSMLEYKKITAFPHTPRVDYTKIFGIINKRFK